ncbi:multidrug effflux MFS transporter [Cypionkella sp.]|jgi:DHA1 family bicyclomycin/chloramphenicol resistance-like MFS transporter|uniref:multidrug effflux MFS transporter n=1 Tax=Cypionkella sp. TaxID=2811411 RepID=UPI0027275763|nr:multidrug effflux MFS transporter [Cypionkella sp.]MDO8982158.1 multidrug effflux MFS transporter [Cypionkella sp.]MDP2048609.1 multidrug effflux MFS transporter [Cypionkella sp.]
MPKSVSLTRYSLILGLVAAVGPFAIDMYLPAMPKIQSDLTTTMQAVQWTIVTYFLAFGVAQMVYGPWADQAGRKPPMYAGLALFMIGTVICAVAPTVEILIFGRFIQGIGGAANMVVLRAMIRDLATGADATRMMSTIMIVIAISPLLAPLSGSALLAFGSWRLVFWALLLAASLSFFLIYFMVDETLPAEKRQRFDLITMRKGLGVLFTDRGFLAMTFLAGFAFASFFVFIASASFVYTGQFGLSPTQFSLAFAINAFGFFAASQFAASISRRVGAKKMIVRATTGFAFATFGLFALALLGFANLYVTIAGLFLANMFLGVVLPTAQVLALEEQGEHAGLAASLGGTMQMVAAGVLVAATGPLMDGTVVPMLGAIALCGVISLVLSRLIPRHAAVAAA